MFDDQNAQPVDACESGQEFCKTLALGARKPGRRLVEQHDLRFERQHHREFQRLLQSVAQEAGLLMQTFGKPGGFQHGACGRRQRQRVRREEQRRALVPCTRDPQAIGHAQGFEHRSRLEFAAKSEGDDALRRQAVDRPPHDLDRSIRALAAVGKAPDQRRLARSVGADEADKFAPARGERYIRKNRQASEALGQPGDFDDHILRGRDRSRSTGRFKRDGTRFRQFRRERWPPARHANRRTDPAAARR